MIKSCNRDHPVGIMQLMGKETCNESMSIHSVFVIFSIIGRPLEWSLSYDEYKEHLVDHTSLMLNLFGHVAQTKQVLATQYNFRLRTPDLVIAVSLKSELNCLIFRLVEII